MRDDKGEGDRRREGEKEKETEREKERREMADPGILSSLEPTGFFPELATVGYSLNFLRNNNDINSINSTTTTTSMGIMDASDTNNIYVVPLANGSDRGNFTGESPQLPTYIWVCIDKLIR